MKSKRFLFLFFFLAVSAVWFFKNRGFADEEEKTSVPGKRVKISWPEDCEFTENFSNENPLKEACAVALDSLSEKLPKGCEYDDFVLGESGRIDFDKYFRFYQIPIRFYTLSNGTFLGELLCKTGAYNQSFVYFIYDEKTLPAKTKILSFESYEVDPSSTEEEETRFQRIESQSLIRFYKKESGELIAFWKHRGMGDCGRFFRYRLSEKNETQLLEFRAKLECDGKLAYSAEEIPVLWTLYDPIPKSRFEWIREKIVFRIDDF